MSIILSSVVLALTTTFGGCAPNAEPAIEAQAPAAETQPKAVSLADAAARPQMYAEQTILLRGKLVNAGTNYFTDRRIVLTDDKGNSVDVLPWLPLSRPGPSAQTRSGTTLAEFLDRQVELVGSLTPRTEPTRKNEFIFNVKSAKILDA
jgi:hypothetical protein